MKNLSLLLISVLCMSPVLATSLMWDDVTTVPAIKIGIDQYQSCKKGLSLETAYRDNKTDEPFKDNKKHYACRDFKKGGQVSDVIIFNTQQLANEYVGDNVTAVGTQIHKLDAQPGQFTVTNVYVDLYYKIK